MEGYRSDTPIFPNKNFDFKQISFNIRKKNYKYLGDGSGRIVYDLENGYVIKVAKNRRGIAQNKAEYKIALENNTDLLAKITHASERYTFLIMEKAMKIKDISYIWEYFNVDNNRELYKIEKLQNICKKNNLEIKDFGRVVNWGQIGGKPVIIDFGFTQQVRRKYYSTLAAIILNRLRI